MRKGAPARAPRSQNSSSQCHRIYRSSHRLSSAIFAPSLHARLLHCCSARAPNPGATAMMHISPQQLAAALGGEVSGNEVLAPGPNHSPKDRSLSIKFDAEAPDGMLVHSFAGDDPLVCKDYIRDRAGLPQWEPTKAKPRVDHIARIRNRPAQSAPPSKPAAYVYQQADGSPYLRVNRTATKGFWQEQWDGSAWVKGAPKIKIPYRLPELVAATDAPVLIVVGEKDADNLLAAGFAATTNSGGAE